MTTPALDPRPWSPTDPHIGPSEDDLAMFTESGDLRDDLGNAVLVLHRVGGAACEAVARAPLPDDFRLVMALADARQALAPRAVDVVSKCVGQLAYADLLLRDLFDDAERGALAVYTACVSKGVAPPLAVQRAGAAYGPGPEGLGRYIQIAANPTAHPIAIADAADRAVIGWCADVVREEADDEAIAKRSVLEYNVTQEGLDHPKDVRGRFAAAAERPSLVTRPGLLARLRRDSGAGMQTAPEVATMPAPPVTVALEDARPAATRQQRQERQKRQERQQRAKPQTATTSSASLKATLQAGMSGTLKAKMGAEFAAALKAQEEAPSDVADLQANLMVPFPERGEVFGTLPPVPLAWSMSPQDARAWASIASESPDGRTKLLRAGYLQDPMGHPDSWQSGQHADKMHIHAEDQRPGDDIESPRAVRISAAELDEAGVPRNSRAVWEYAMRNSLADPLTIDSSGRSNPLKLGRMAAMGSAEPGGDWYIVMKPESFVMYSGGEEAPMPVAAEMVIADVDPYSPTKVRGNNEGSPDYPDYRLDPNQVLRLMGEPITLWKQTGTNDNEGHLVQRYQLSPVDRDHPDAMWEGFRKAAATVEADVSTWNARHREHPKDAMGRWSSTAESRPNLRERLRPVEALTVEQRATPLKTRQSRQERQRRSERQAPLQQATVEATMQGRAEAKMSAEMAASLRAAIIRRMKTEPERVILDYDFPVALDDRPIHKHMTWHQWGAFLANHAPYNMADDPKPVELDNAGKMALLQMRDLDGDEVMKRLRLGVAKQITEDHHGAMREVLELRRDVGPGDDESMDRFLNDIDEYMTKHPEVSMARVEAPQRFHSLRVYVNARPVNDQVIIYMPEDFNPDLPVTLRWLGKPRREALARGRWQLNDPTKRIDAPVSVYRVEQRLYRAEQD